jgi:hypothetical protein
MVILETITQGEAPPPLVHSFEDPNLDPIDLTGYTCTWEQMNPDGTTQSKTAGDVIYLDEDPTDGNVTIVWVETDFVQAGVYNGELWVSNGTNRFSEKFKRVANPAVQIPSL